MGGLGSWRWNAVDGCIQHIPSVSQPYDFAIAVSVKEVAGGSATRWQKRTVGGAMMGQSDSDSESVVVRVVRGPTQAQPGQNITWQSFAPPANQHIHNDTPSASLGGFHNGAGLAKPPKVMSRSTNTSPVVDGS